MKIFTSTYKVDRQIFSVTFVLIFVLNLGIIPNDIFSGVDSSNLHYEISIPDVGAAIPIETIIKSKKTVKRIFYQIKINLFNHFSVCKIFERTHRTQTIKDALSFHDVKMDESFLINQFSTDI